jgi:hypothetical protein
MWQKGSLAANREPTKGKARHVPDGAADALELVMNTTT